MISRSAGSRSHTLQELWCNGELGGKLVLGMGDTTRKICFDTATSLARIPVILPTYLPTYQWLLPFWLVAQLSWLCPTQQIAWDLARLLICCAGRYRNLPMLLPAKRNLSSSIHHASNPHASSALPTKGISSGRTVLCSTRSAGHRNACISFGLPGRRVLLAYPSTSTSISSRSRSICADSRARRF